MTRLLLAGAVLATVTACGGDSCDGLPALERERDEARAAYSAVVADEAAGRASGDDVDAAHEVMHGLDVRYADAAERCEG